MTNITFDPIAFRTLFPPFNNQTCLPDATLQAFFDTASQYVSPTVWSACGGKTVAQQTLMLNLATAHVAFLFNAANAGQATGVLQSATIDKVSITVKAPPIQNGSMFQWWFAQSPYGQQLLALLSIVAAGGRYLGGSPERAGFGSVANGFGRGRAW